MSQIQVFSITVTLLYLQGLRGREKKWKIRAATLDVQEFS